MRQRPQNQNVFENEPKIPYDIERPTLFDKRIWMNTKEAAEYLRVSVNSLRLKVWKRQIPAYKFDRHLRFKKVDLDQHMRPLR